MDASEVEFIAEKEMVEIIPNFSLDKIYLIGGDLGPFNPGLSVNVPVWLALNLKQRQKCRIVPPEWMSVEKLEEMRELERKEDTFTPVPRMHTNDEADEIRTLVKDIWDTRIAKLRLSADSFINQQEAHAKLDNLTLMEINTIRSFLLDSLNCMYKLRSNLQPGSTKGQFDDY
uniref:DNA replication complex GINS protein PSF2 n=1 Tax=Neogobius melanostomus TaxID=47308 RepID=A0A8C6SI58_9GOBI